MLTDLWTSKGGRAERLVVVVPEGENGNIDSETTHICIYT